MMETNWLDPSKGCFQSQYILGDVIGRGSTSMIHSCLHKGKKKYACRIIPKSKLSKEETVRRIETLLKLKHENIIAVKEAFDDLSRVYIIENLALGGELLEKFASCGGYSEKDAAKAIRDIASALDYLHQLGIYHGNLRPEKLLYTKEDGDPQLVLTDISVTVDILSPYKILYYAPEVTVTGKPRLSSDVWSLGIILYIMLCGFEPFRNAQEMFPSPHWDDKTEEAKSLTAWLMEDRPEDRPTAKEILENPWVKGEKTAEHSMTDAVARLREFNARRKFKAATLAVCATHRAIALSHCREEIIG